MQAAESSSLKRKPASAPRAYTVLILVWTALLGFIAAAAYLSYLEWSSLSALALFCGLLATYPVARLTKAITASEHGFIPLRSGFAPLDLLLWHVRQHEFELSEALESAQTRIANLEERHRLLTDNLAASVVVRDLSGRILYASPYTEVLTGYTLAELYQAEGDFFRSAVHEQDRDQYAKAFQIMSMGESYQLRYRFIHRTGMELWFESRTVPLVGENDEVISFLSVTFDVTQNVRYQRQVEERNRDLHDFTYMVSHDLKAPLYTMKGMIQVLEDEIGPKLEGDSKEALMHIQRAAANLEALIASVLRYSRVSAAETAFEPVDLNAVLQDVVHDLAIQISDAKAQITVDSGLPFVQGDKAKLYQVFSNLVGNAIKFRAPERPCSIRVSCETNAHEVILRVQDNGLGIPEEKLPVIFRPFQRGHQGSKTEGWGVGLASVVRIMEKIGGRLEVQSILDNGSVFSVHLRRQRSAAAKP